ncbi:Pre-rRNA-processing protein TSR1 like, partial [Pseudolycoriella hygida]
MGLDRVAHRAGVLKQRNKAHKTGRHRSKGVIENEQKGKVSVKTMTKRHKQLVRKDQRRNQANQIRKNKREKVLAKKRSLGLNDTAPFLVCILPLNEQIDPRSALAILENCDPTVTVAHSLSGVTHLTVPRFKQRFSFITPPVGRGNEFTALDCLKVCDTTMLLMTANSNEDEIFDRWGKRVLNMATAQGIPTPILSLMDLESIAPKRKQQVKMNVQKFISKLFPEEKVMCLDTNGDGLNHLRRIGGQKKNILHNKTNRPHMYAESVNFVVNPTDESFGTLEVTGFLRGVPLNVNNLIHIPGLGDFQMSRIDAPTDIYKMVKE